MIRNVLLRFFLDCCSLIVFHEDPLPAFIQPVDQLAIQCLQLVAGTCANILAVGHGLFLGLHCVLFDFPAPEIAVLVFPVRRFLAWLAGRRCLDHFGLDLAGLGRSVSVLRVSVCIDPFVDLSLGGQRHCTQDKEQWRKHNSDHVSAFGFQSDGDGTL